jgi:hypothetical protein
MSNDWIFEVLGDLRLFALSNEMPEFAGKLEEAMRAGRRESSRLRESDPYDQMDAPQLAQRMRPN